MWRGISSARSGLALGGNTSMRSACTKTCSLVNRTTSAPLPAWLERGKPRSQTEACLQVSNLVRRALGGGPRHHGRIHHPFRGVIDGHHTITIDHPVFTHHITAVRSWQAEGDYRCGKANRAGRPVFSSINGVGPRSAEAGPTHFAVGKFDLWKTRLKFGDHALPVLASVGRSVQLSIGADLVSSVRIEKNHIPDALIIGFLGPHKNIPGCSTIFRLCRDSRIAHGIAHRRSRKMKSPKITVFFLR